MDKIICFKNYSRYTTTLNFKYIAMTYKLPELKYSYDALEPNIDAQTLELHHSKHHASYVAGLNNATQKLKEARENGDFSLVKFWKKELAFHGAGHKLHTLYWENLSPEKTEMSQELKSAIEEKFGSLETFEKEFKASSTVVEGSGWSALVMIDGELEILTVEKHQDLVIPGAKILLVCDVWEHAYYLKYQNRRPEYIDAFWNVIDWEAVSERFSK